MTLSETTGLYVNTNNNPFAKKDEQKADNSVSEKQATSEITLYGDNATPATKSSTNNNDNIGLVSQDALKADENMGLGIQRTTTTNPVVKPQSANPTVSTTSTSATTESSQPKSKFPAYAENDPVWTQNAENNKRTGKPRFEDTLRSFYGAKFDKMTSEEKEQAAVNFFKWIGTDKKDVISQSKQFELYMNRCESAEEYEFLCSVIDKMDASEQAKTVDIALNTGTEGQQTVAMIAVDNDLDNYDKSAITSITQSLADRISKIENSEIKQAIIDQTANMDKYFMNLPADVQRDCLVKMRAEFEELYKRNASPEEIRALSDRWTQYFASYAQNEDADEASRVELGIFGAGLVQHASKENQLGLSEQFFSSKSPKKVKLAMANQGHNLDVENQSAFVDMAMGLEDEDVANVIANNAYNYDETLRDYVIDLLKNSGYDSVNETLNKAEQRYNESKANSKSSSDESSSEIDVTSSKEETNTTSSKISMQEGVERIVSDNRLNINQKAIKIKGLTNKEQQKLAISKMIPSSTLPEIKNLLLSGLKSEVFDYLLSNVTPENIATLDSIKQFMQPQHLKKYNEIIGLKYNTVVNDATNVISPQRRNFFIS